MLESRVALVLSALVGDGRGRRALAYYRLPLLTTPAQLSCGLGEHFPNHLAYRLCQALSRATYDYGAYRLFVEVKNSARQISGERIDLPLAH